MSKLEILAEAARFDVACTSSGSNKNTKAGKLGTTHAAGCCHSFTEDGRCITLLKVLMSNACSFDCAYCVNRKSASCARATFTPRELAELTIEFYKHNYIEGLFLSSGVLGTADATVERMIACLHILREELQFNGYIHTKIIPGTSPELIDIVGKLSDRLSINLELPSASSLDILCPDKTAASLLEPMALIHSKRLEEETHLLGSTQRSFARQSQSFGNLGYSKCSGQALISRGTSCTMRKTSGVGSSLRSFAAAGQSTQIIVGASPEDDNHILKLSSSLYRKFDLKRVFFSAYMPMLEDARLPELGTPVPLRREHRLYQADWLMRYYNFDADELVNPDAPWLDLEVDPKLAWALKHLDCFPIEVMDASLELLLRVPGVGPVGARRIIQSRHTTLLTFDDLKRMHVTLKRARHFLTCCGKRDPHSPLDPQLIRHRVVNDAKASTYNQRRKELEEQQLRLF
ncbi:putative DNA modification/repair radical SAM protein [Atopobium fossor]|uniref:putative DNA modification/repair radical SAM protein n=1 Tax=Atopobium fossor TaxID=39487 RepID=UPI000A06362D|nr:putative DNA modification/repair radical SAM protein [Atopobium fossor]